MSQLRKPIVLVALSATLLWSAVALTQETTPVEAPAIEVDDDPDAPAPAAPKAVEIDPLAEDQEIADRLANILAATDWFIEPRVQVDEGVVFLAGSTHREEYREWAEQLAGNTQDVVAVVNQIKTIERDMWDLTPAWNEVRGMGREFVQSVPLLIVALALLVATWFAAKFFMGASHWAVGQRVRNNLLRSVISRAIAIPVFLIGLYLILRVSGLSRLAMTLLGGTGIVGLVIGIAFRDIAENFLASVLISMNNPFKANDLIEVAGHKGLVQQVTTRGTLLMTLDGNHVQIPNATIYKETIINYSANPNVRCNFVVGIGYDDSIAEAQTVAMRVLAEHPAVVNDPEPMVLVESLGASTVNLRIYFWIDAARYSILKVPSAVLRLSKHAFEEAGISMPDEAREVVFPNGVPLMNMPTPDQRGGEEPGQLNKPDSTPMQPEPRIVEEDLQASNAAEGGLESEVAEIEEQARKSRVPEKGANLLSDA